VNGRLNEREVDLGGRWSFGVSDHCLTGSPTSESELAQAGLVLFPATVPGNLELDLLANGLIDEPFQGMNIVGLRQYERAWVYLGQCRPQRNRPQILSPPLSLCTFTRVRTVSCAAVPELAAFARPARRYSPGSRASRCPHGCYGQPGHSRDLTLRRAALVHQPACAALVPEL
jgi:hypothetical protein